MGEDYPQQAGRGAVSVPVSMLQSSASEIMENLDKEMARLKNELHATINAAENVLEILRRER